MSADPWAPPEGKGYHEGAVSPECGQLLVYIGAGLTEIKRGLTEGPGCVYGCCDDYICDHCGYKFRVEWPD